MDQLTSLHLRQTAAWCTQQLGAGFAMRTAALRPDLLTSDDPLTQLNAIHDHQELLPTTVNYICKQRQQIIEATGVSLPEIDACFQLGRVYCTDFDTDSCAAATEPSRGFFNDCDIPGWDSWFACEPTDRLIRLYGWVPNETYDAVNYGMLVIPVECVWWVERVPATAK